MGHESIVYGYIEGATYKSEDYRRLQRLNRAVVRRLPIEDNWPPLNRQMFSIPNGKPAQGTYRSQLIHFGGTFKSIEWEWDEWIEKFEALLRKLYWYGARAHLETELDGDYSYEWVITSQAIDGFFDEPPRPVTQWDFSGGPRRFDYDNPRGYAVNWSGCQVPAHGLLTRG